MLIIFNQKYINYHNFILLICNNIRLYYIILTYMDFKCKRCKYETPRKADYLRHMTSNKHKKNRTKHIE